jgi:hypothetical protein
MSNTLSHSPGSNVNLKLTLKTVSTPSPGHLEFVEKVVAEMYDPKRIIKAKAYTNRVVAKGMPKGFTMRHNPLDTEFGWIVERINHTGQVVEIICNACNEHIARRIAWAVGR